MLIPYVFDKKRYLLYAVSLFITICIGIQLKEFGRDFASSIKIFLIYSYITGTGMAFFFLRRTMLLQRENAEKEELQKQMELKYLKEQVNPHFLFNALNSIYSLSKSKSPETPDLVMQLSQLMRYQLESSKKDLVLLKEELEFIENYLLVEDRRLSGRCIMEFSIEDDFSEIGIPPMLLIPFIENAIKHGAQSTNDKSLIEVSASINDGVFKFYVKNSKPKDLVKNQRIGLGLENVKKRLKLLYPDKHSLVISDRENNYEIELSITL